MKYLIWALALPIGLFVTGIASAQHHGGGHRGGYHHGGYYPAYRHGGGYGCGGYVLGPTVAVVPAPVCAPTVSVYTPGYCAPGVGVYAAPVYTGGCHVPVYGHGPYSHHGRHR